MGAPRGVRAARAGRPLPPCAPSISPAPRRPAHVERALHAVDGGGPVLAPHDQLAQQRVVVGGHLRGWGEAGRRADALVGRAGAGHARAAAPARTSRHRGPHARACAARRGAAHPRGLRCRAPSQRSNPPGSRGTGGCPCARAGRPAAGRPPRGLRGGGRWWVAGRWAGAPRGTPGRRAGDCQARRAAPQFGTSAGLPSRAARGRGGQAAARRGLRAPGAWPAAARGGRGCGRAGRTRAGAEVLEGLLRVDAALDGVAVDLDVLLAALRGAAGGGRAAGE